jgi:hypothetical protein
MRRPCFAGGRLFLALFIGIPFLVLGCSDVSRTTGTMVEQSDEEKAFRNKKVEVYQAKAKAKAEAKVARKKR